MSLSMITFKKHKCSLNGNAGKEISNKYVNIYVKITDSCNASCKFCEYGNKDPKFKFNLKRFKQIILEIKRSYIDINKVSFTGGEPTTNLEDLQDAISFVRRNLRATFIVVSTNGYKLNSLVPIYKKSRINSIALSRHHFHNTTNEEIFGTKSVPDFKEIQEVQKVTKNIHLSCNLIREYVDSQNKLARYMYHASKFGLYDIGFVDLMPVNEFAKSHFVDFSKNIQLNSKLICCNFKWEYDGICKCNNYLYLPKSGSKVTKFYIRQRTKQDVPVGSNVVFDGEYLRENFGGQKIL